MTKASNTPGWMVGGAVAAMLITGTVNTLATKIQFKIESTNLDGVVTEFHKPWFGSFNMLFAMAVVGLVDKLFRSLRGERALQPERDVGLLDSDADGSKRQLSYTKKVLYVSVPAFLDLVATAACCIGIMYIPASVWQMLRGSALIFAAILSVLFLKRKLLGFNYVGLFLCVVGITLVGMANLLAPSADVGSSDKSDKGDDVIMVMFGMSIVLIGQILQAAQVIAEEWLMKDVDLPALVVIGWEGVWGIIMFVFIVYPLLYSLDGNDRGHQEDPFDTVVMIKNSGTLLTCVVTYIISCGTFNASGIAVTASLSGVHRMMLDASRTIAIWSFGLAVHYGYDENSKFGEVWNSYSWLQIVGFCILVSGQAIYGGVIRLPFCQYPEEEKLDFAAFASPASIHLCTPLPPRSGDL
jgi:drug/metabolite transporter (DMT)-like permease